MKPFCCQDCGKISSPTNYLTRHIPTQTEEKPRCYQRCVKIYQLIVDSPGTYEHTLVKKRIVASTVEKHVSMLTT